MNPREREQIEQDLRRNNCTPELAWWLAQQHEQLQQLEDKVRRLEKQAKQRSKRRTSKKRAKR